MAKRTGKIDGQLAVVEAEYAKIAATNSKRREAAARLHRVIQRLRRAIREENLEDATTFAWGWGMYCAMDFLEDGDRHHELVKAALPKARSAKKEKAAHRCELVRKECRKVLTGKPGLRDQKTKVVGILFRHFNKNGRRKTGYGESTIRAHIADMFPNGSN